MAEAVRNRRLVSNFNTNFVFKYYLDSLDLFDRYRARWWDKARIPVAERRRLERTMLRHPAATIRVDTPVQLQLLVKV